MFVSTYNSRPVLYIKEDPGSQKYFVLAFGDSVKRFAEKSKEDFLEEAFSERPFGGKFERTCGGFKWMKI
jgi:hypothetical protein